MRQTLGGVGLVAIALIPATLMSQNPTAVTPAAITAGRTIFRGAGTCAMCHGATLGGGVGPQLTSADGWKDAKGGSYEAILSVVTKGVPGTAMASHPGGISDAQAEQVAAYVWAVSHGKAKP
jgi:mono/diheme cytochrome c family protein